MSFLDVVLVLIGVVFIAFSRPLAGEKADVFDRDTTATIRGVAVLGIILHHIHNRLLFGSPILLSVGYLATGMFFFVSGYGNTLSLGKSQTVDLKWIIRKFSKIYIPYFVVYWVYYIFDVLLYPSEVPSFTETVKDIFTISLPNMVTWFPKIILLCFLLHWVVKKLLRNAKLQFVAISVVLCGAVLVMWKLDFGGYWYNSVLCYPFGVIVAIEKERLMKIIDGKLRRVLFFAFSVILFGALFVTSRYTGNLPYIQIPCAAVFSLMCFAFTTLFRTETKFMSWVGNNSFEFYLIHLVCCQIFCNLIPVNQYIYALCVVVASVLSVFVYVYIKGLLTKAKSRKSLEK